MSAKIYHDTAMRLVDQADAARDAGDDATRNTCLESALKAELLALELATGQEPTETVLRESAKSIAEEWRAA